MNSARRWLAAMLALLTLVSGVVTASEVAAHGLCEHAGSSLLVDSMHAHSHVDSQGDDRRGHDHSGHDHICHVHPPAHGQVSAALPAPPPLAAVRFAFVPHAFQSLLQAPPVPPPNA